MSRLNWGRARRGRGGPDERIGREWEREGCETSWPTEMGCQDRFEPPTREDLVLERIYREYGSKLLAAYAKCYLGRMRLEELPRVPAELAERINRAGGLTAWINMNAKRLERFWEFVAAQSKSAGAATDLRSSPKRTLTEPSLPK